MKNKSFSEMLNEALAKEPDLNLIPLDIEKVKKSIPQNSSEKLCEMIVCDRYFGFGQKISPFCMEELGKRRMAGDTFDFENYIDQAYKSLPVIPTVIPNIRDVLQQALDVRNKK
jgi:hypothetical protein